VKKFETVIFSGGFLTVLLLLPGVHGGIRLYSILCSQYIKMESENDCWRRTVAKKISDPPARPPPAAAAPGTPGAAPQSPDVQPPAHADPRPVTAGPEPSTISASPSTKDKPEAFEEKIDYREAEPMNGVFAYLAQKHGGNPHQKGVVYVTASGTLANHPWQVLDKDWKSHWVSEDSPEQWIRFEFKTARMFVTHYALKTYNSCAGGNHLKSWVLDGSSSDKDWLELDHRHGSNDLNGRSKVKAWAVKNPGTYRILRLTQAWKTHCDSDIVALTGVEFFGTLKMD
jgi:hypothetical protein